MEKDWSNPYAVPVKSALTSPYFSTIAASLYWDGRNFPTSNNSFDTGSRFLRRQFPAVGLKDENGTGSLFVHTIYARRSYSLAGGFRKR
jgi:hypothetical protein